ncbi:hypothetical protein Esti_001951 [Eimeria stiedai]
MQTMLSTLAGKLTNSSEAVEEGEEVAKSPLTMRQIAQLNGTELRACSPKEDSWCPHAIELLFPELRDLGSADRTLPAATDPLRCVNVGRQPQALEQSTDTPIELSFAATGELNEHPSPSLQRCLFPAQTQASTAARSRESDDGCRNGQQGLACNSVSAASSVEAPEKRGSRENTIVAPELAVHSEFFSVAVDLQAEVKRAAAAHTQALVPSAYASSSEEEEGLPAPPHRAAVTPGSAVSPTRRSRSHSTGTPRPSPNSSPAASQRSAAEALRFLLCGKRSTTASLRQTEGQKSHKGASPTEKDDSLSQGAGVSTQRVTMTGNATPGKLHAARPSFQHPVSSLPHTNRREQRAPLETSLASTSKRQRTEHPGSCCLSVYPLLPEQFDRRGSKAVEKMTQNSAAWQEIFYYATTNPSDIRVRY